MHMDDMINSPADGFTQFHWSPSGVNAPRNAAIKAGKKKSKYCSVGKKVTESKQDLHLMMI